MLLGPVAFAFAAGMVATVNPCGFAMVPAYLSLFLTDRAEETPRSSSMTGLRVGLVVTLAFVATFVAVGAVFELVSTSVVDIIPWAALVVGVVLALAGAAVLTGRHLRVRTIQIRFAKDQSNRSMALFGVAYAVASVSCTLPIFLAVTAAATTASSIPEGITVFAAYGLGMGVVLTALAVAVATSRQRIVQSLRRLMPYVERIGGWLLVVSGLFIVYYWTTLLSVDPGSDSPVLAPAKFVARISNWFTTQIGNNTVIWALVLLVLIVIVVTAERRRSGQRRMAAVSALDDPDRDTGR